MGKLWDKITGKDLKRRTQRIMEDPTVDNLMKYMPKDAPKSPTKPVATDRKPVDIQSAAKKKKKKGQAGAMGRAKANRKAAMKDLFKN